MNNYRQLKSKSFKAIIGYLTNIPFSQLKALLTPHNIHQIHENLLTTQTYVTWTIFAVMEVSSKGLLKKKNR